MKITEEKPGEWIAVLDLPIAPEDLTELAAQLPVDVVCTHVDGDADGRTLYMTWEVHRVIPVD
ncbi:hypothetical protein ACVMYR_10075 [Micromonospora sp. PTRAS2]